MTQQFHLGYANAGKAHKGRYVATSNGTTKRFHTFWGLRFYLWRQGLAQPLELYNDGASFYPLPDKRFAKLLR